MHQLLLAGAVLKPRLIEPVFRALGTLQFVQQDFKISLGDNKFFDMIVNWIILLANILGNNFSPAWHESTKAHGNQKCSLCEIIWEILAEIENQVRHSVAAIDLLDFLHNICLDNSEGVHHVDRGRICSFSFVSTIVPSRFKS